MATIVLMSIDQKRFSRTGEVNGTHLWLVLMKAYHAVASYTAQSYRGSGLGDSDFRVLEVLLHKGPLPVNTIGPKVFLTPGSISIAIERLKKKGLVSRGEHPDDRRIKVVELTAKGRALISKVFAAHAQCVEQVADVLSQGERNRLLQALKKLGFRAEGRDVEEGG